jgi:hypothetical protein
MDTILSLQDQILERLAALTATQEAHDRAFNRLEDDVEGVRAQVHRNHEVSTLSHIFSFLSSYLLIQAIGLLNATAMEFRQLIEFLQSFTTEMNDWVQSLDPRLQEVEARVFHQPAPIRYAPRGLGRGRGGRYRGGNYGH